jgi:hypothetical protein
VVKVIAYQWEVFPFSSYRSDGLARYTGITDSASRAIEHVESVLKSDSQCAAGVFYPVVSVYSATYALSYEWVQTTDSKRRFCVRTLRDGCRWFDNPVKAVAI